MQRQAQQAGRQAGTLSAPPEPVAAQAPVLRRQPAQQRIVGARHLQRADRLRAQACALAQRVLRCARHPHAQPLEQRSLLQRRRQLRRQRQAQQAARRPVLGQQVVLQVGGQVVRHAAKPLRYTWRGAAGYGW